MLYILFFKYLFQNKLEDLYSSSNLLCKSCKFFEICCHIYKMVKELLWGQNNAKLAETNEHYKTLQWVKHKKLYILIDFSFEKPQNHKQNLRKLMVIQNKESLLLPFLIFNSPSSPISNHCLYCILCMSQNCFSPPTLSL